MEHFSNAVIISGASSGTTSKNSSSSNLNTSETPADTVTSEPSTPNSASGTSLNIVRVDEQTHHHDADRKSDGIEGSAGEDRELTV
jgi:hypothetical protein